MSKKILEGLLSIIAAAILLQTLYFKFSGAPESVALFTKLGVEPYGRIGTGVLELIAGILLLWPAHRVWGALLGLGLMTGAIMSHLTIIGIVSMDDGGLLFGLAITVWICCGILLLRNRQWIIQRFKPAKTI